MQLLIRERITIMLEKEPSGATRPDVTPKISGSSLGGPFDSPNIQLKQTMTPAEPTVEMPLPFRQFTLQFLIAVIQKHSHKE
jgi:hypothetical protein